MLAGRRDRHSLATQQNPHEGEGARLAAMAQEAEVTLTSLQAMSPSPWLASPSAAGDTCMAQCISLQSDKPHIRRRCHCR